MNEIQFKPETLQLMQGIIRRYPAESSKSALLPVLHIAQAEHGWLSVPVMDKVAEIMNLQPIEVYEVASFYTMYHLKPVGNCMIEVCRTSSCWIRGAYDVISYIEHRLGIKAGETTSDGKFSLRTVECLGSCGTAPMLQIGETFYENLTLERVDEIINEHRNMEQHSSYLDNNTFVVR